jgi:hypothetical protein
MTVEHGAAEAAVKIRNPRSSWMWMVIVGGFCFVFATAQVMFGWPVLAVGWLFAGCLWVAGGLWIRTRGVDLTSESAIVRRVRRRIVPWPEVQAVLRVSGAWRVQLILESGEAVTLLAPRLTVWGSGRAEFERDFHRIGQWWLAHRGGSWHPMRPEAPGLPVQG